MMTDTARAAVAHPYDFYNATPMMKRPIPKPCAGYSQPGDPMNGLRACWDSDTNLSASRASAADGRVPLSLVMPHPV